MARKTRSYLEIRNKNPETRSIFSAALYIRLSKENGGRQTQDTVENQQILLEEFTKTQPDIEIYKIYIDNGFSGINFERPAFQKMMEDIRKENVNCIIVKDLSRFGRNYLETGNYLENLFPTLKIRFISITDHFDTYSLNYSDNDLLIPLKNIINEIYARDISQKIHSALDIKKREGTYGGGVAPYGYHKSKEKGIYEIDEEVAEVVRYIYKLRLQGCSYCKIAKILNEKGIKSPSAYRFEKGIVRNKQMQKVGWKRDSIEDILHNQVYLGNMVRGKTSCALYKGEKRHSVPESKWIIVPKRHEPIISKELFDAVQKVNSKTICETYSA